MNKMGAEVITVTRTSLQTLLSAEGLRANILFANIVTTFEEIDGTKLSGFQTVFQTGSSPNIQVGLAWGVNL